MVNGMATRKVTVTLYELQLDRIRALVEAGSAPSVSGFVQHAVNVALDDVAGWARSWPRPFGRPAAPCPTRSARGRWDPGFFAGIEFCGLMPGVTLDAGALIALERDDRRVLVLLARAHETGARITVPATALAQVVRAPGRQVRLARLVRQPTTEVVPLGRVDATNVGRLLDASGISDITDAHVVICARRAGHHVATSHPDDLRLLDPNLCVVLV